LSNSSGSSQQTLRQLEQRLTCVTRCAAVAQGKPRALVMLTRGSLGKSPHAEGIHLGQDGGHVHLRRGVERAQFLAAFQRVNSGPRLFRVATSLSADLPVSASSPQMPKTSS
jgi:hypothetical protein